MKPTLALFSICLLTACSAFASSFATSSRDLSFNGRTPDEAVSACQANRVTRDSECSQNVSAFQAPRRQPDDRRGPDDRRDNAIPAGSYQLSCRNASRNGSYLSADCKTRRGKWVYTQLNLDRCDVNGVNNDDGQLTCGLR